MSMQHRLRRRAPAEEGSAEDQGLEAAAASQGEEAPGPTGPPYKKVDAEYARRAGKVPITMKWVDRNKGDNERHNYRSRLVCREIKRAHHAEYIPEYATFSAMPPLEASEGFCFLRWSR